MAGQHLVKVFSTTLLVILLTRTRREADQGTATIIPRFIGHSTLIVMETTIEVPHFRDPLREALGEGVTAEITTIAEFL